MKTLSQTLLALGLVIFSFSVQAQNSSSKKVSSGNKIKDGRKSVISKAYANNDSAMVVKPQAIPTKGFRVYGTIKGVGKGVIHVITYNNIPGDSAVIVDGKFIIQGNLKEPDRKGFYITPGNWNFSLLMEDTTITATIDTADALHQPGGGVDHPMIWHVDQTGSDFGDAYTRYFNETGQFAAISLMKQFKFAAAADRASIMSKIDSLRGTMMEKQKTWIENYIQQNPTSVAGVFIFSEFYHNMLAANPPKGYLQLMLGKFKGKATAYKDYKSLLAEAGNLKNRDANTVVPDFTLLQRNKAKFELSSKRGKIVLIDFWASWCVPCRKAIPGWKELYAKYKSKGFDMVSIAEDENLKNWYAALDKEKMPWTQVVDDFSNKQPDANVLNLFPTRYIPLYVLLDKEGKVIISGNDDTVIAKKVAELLD